MKKLLFVALGLILTLSMVLPSCSSGSSSGASKTEIKIGAVNSLTGANVETGADQKWAFEQAVADINAAGGIMLSSIGKKLPVKLVFEDDQSTPDGAAAAMEKLIKVDKVDLVLGSNNDKLNNAAATVADKYKMFFQSGGGWWGDDYESQNFTWAADMFFTAKSAGSVPFEIWNSMPAAQRPKKIAIMVMNIPDGKIFGDGIEATAKAFGYDIVDYDQYAMGAKDFSSSVLKMENAGADALLWLGTTPDSITLMNSIKAENYNLKYIHGWMGMWPSQFYNALGKDANYVVHDGFWSPAFGAPGSEKLDQEYRSSHDNNASASIGMYYAIVQVLAQAIERAGSVDSQAVRDQVRGGTFKGTTMGDVTYKADGFCETPSIALQWMDGKSEPVWPTVSTYEFQWVPAWNARP